MAGPAMKIPTTIQKTVYKTFEPTLNAKLVLSCENKFTGAKMLNHTANCVLLPYDY